MSSFAISRASLLRGVSLFARVFFTLTAVYALYLSFTLFSLSLDGQDASSYAAEVQSARMKRQAQEAAAAHLPPRTPWPPYPGTRVRNVKSVTVNDTPFVNDTMEIAASRDRILGFYRRRLGSMGWRDVTEEHFKLQPDALNCSGHARNLQNEAYLRHYDEVMRSSLVLKRRNESLQIRTGPGSKRNRTQVLFSYMGAESIEDFGTAFEARAKQARRSRGRDSWVESSEVIGPDLYTTEMYRSPLSPPNHYAQLLGKLESNGWKTMPQSRLLMGKSDAKHFAYLSRGPEFAMVFVRANTRDRGSYGLVTTVIDK